MNWSKYNRSDEISHLKFMHFFLIVLLAFGKGAVLFRFDAACFRQFDVFFGPAVG